VKVWLPRFKFTVPVELTGTLQKMGIVEAFRSEACEFSRG